MKAGKIKHLVAAIGIALFIVSGPAAASSTVYQGNNCDLIGTPYYNSVTRLETLGVLQSVYGVYPVARPAPRDYVAGALVRMLQLENLVSAAEGPTVYKDVNPASALSGEVNLLDELNIMHGSDGVFQPQAPITGTEAVRAVMSALYYGEGVNGFANGTVLRTAGQVGLIDAQTFKPDETLSMGQLALLLDNAVFDVQLPGSRETLANSRFGVDYCKAWVKESPINGAPYNELVFSSPVGGVAAGTPVPLLLAPNMDVDSYLGQKVLVGVKQLDIGGQINYEVIYLKRLPPSD